MAAGEPCGVCGETETKLVDGYYYCTECGTQDTRVQETIVEGTQLADGTFGISRRTRYKIKIQEGVTMPPQWYKWHKHNFLLAGLTQQLVELGAAPTVKMKVLWIWTRYLKKFQKKGEMDPSDPLTLQDSASSASDEEGDGRREEQTEEELMKHLRKFRLNRATNLVAILALALNIDHSHLQLSHMKRFARFRLLTVKDIFHLVPAEILDHCKRGDGFVPNEIMYNDMEYLMGRLSTQLELGAPVTPDIDQIIKSLLRELRLPGALAALVRALMVRAPIPFEGHKFAKVRAENTFPDYERAVLAYVVVALKMCFGLDDDRERRLSHAVDRFNQESGHPVAYASAPEPTARLFSFRAWAAHVSLRARTLARHHAPTACARAEPVPPLVALDHLRETTLDRPPHPDQSRMRKGARARVSDQVTMELLHKIPLRAGAGAAVLPRDALRAAAAAPEPHTALLRAAARLLPPATRALLDEDFTQYSLDYAFQHLSLPGESADLFRGVRDHPADERDKFGAHFQASNADYTMVFVKNCPNKNWTKTERPTAAHILEDYDDDVRGRDERDTDERKLETFDEEKEGANIFDDDFADITIKEEKSETKDDPEINETKVETDWINDFENFGDENKSEDEVRDIFDSDEEEPQFDPSTFDRKEVIKEIMIATYAKLKTKPPSRFQTEQTLNTKKQIAYKDRKRQSKEYTRRTVQWDARRILQERRADVDGILAGYRDAVHLDVLYQIQQHVRAATDRAHPEPAAAPPPPESVHSSHTDAIDGSRTDANVDDGDVEMIERDGKTENNDDDFGEEAYDPIFRSDERFDEKTHDVEQLYLKVTKVPSPEPAGDGLDDDVTAIIDKRIQRQKKTRHKRKAPVIKTDIDHLVDDPERIDRFSYWFTTVDKFSKKNIPRRLEKEIQEWCPRSFWFVLKECAAVLDTHPASLYSLVADIEEEMLWLLKHRVSAGRRNPRKCTKGLKATLQSQEPRQRGRHRKHTDLGFEAVLQDQEPKKTFCKNTLRNQEPSRRGSSCENKSRDLSEASDSQEVLSNPSSDSDSSQEGRTILRDRQLKKRGRPRKSLDLSVASDVRGARLRGKEAAHNQKHRTKRGMPRKNDSGSSDWLESDSESPNSYSDSSLEIPRKRGRLRKSLDKKLSDASDLQKQRAVL